MQKTKVVKSWKRIQFPVLMGVIFLHVTLVSATATKHLLVRPENGGGSTGHVAGKSTRVNSVTIFMARSLDVYDSLHLDMAGLSRRTFQLALKGMEKMVRKGQVRDNILSIVDFSQPSTQKRLYVIDLENGQLLFNTWVAHGMSSGKEMARAFSNKMSSHKSSLGFYVTGQPYRGSNGYSLRLQGVEKGINDYAYRRAIVIHGADYVNENFINSQGYIGRSQGCPAVSVDVCQPLIDEIKDNSCLFIYHPTSSYAKKSRLLM